MEQKFWELREAERQVQDEDARRERESAKEAEAAERKKDRESEAKLLAEAKEFDRKHGNCDKPRPKVLEVELLALGGIKKAVWHEDGVQSQIIFGGEGETRLMFTPRSGAWWVDLEGKRSLDPKRSLEDEDLKRELCRFGHSLWDNDNQKPDIAFQAVDALLSCSRDWQEFIALPKSEQQKADVYRAMVDVHLAISATLLALKRDAKTPKARKLQLAYKLLTDVLTDDSGSSRVHETDHAQSWLPCPNASRSRLRIEKVESGNKLPPPPRLKIGL
jgi:hypothetical protein